MNTEAIRAKFEIEIRPHLTGMEAVIALQKDSTGYIYEGTANQFEQYLKGYQQAVKDMEAEMVYLKEHHSLTESAIGLARLHLDTCVDEIDKLVNDHE